MVREETTGAGRVCYAFLPPGNECSATDAPCTLAFVLHQQLQVWKHAVAKVTHSSVRFGSLGNS